jgi:antirestriction protein ArdC
MSNHAYCARTGQDRANLYDEITDKIVAELEAGRVPWVQPWGTAAAKACLAIPRNASTGRQYSGVNILLLLGIGHRARVHGAELARLPSGALSWWPCA